MTVNNFTKNMQAMLPEWMKMAKDPNSVGAQFLDSFSVEFVEVQSYLDETLNNQYIGNTNIGKIDYCYKIPVALPKVLDMSENMLIDVSFSINNESFYAIQTHTLKDFYESEEASVIIDREEGYVYLKVPEEFMELNMDKPFEYVSIDSTNHFEYYLHPIWNSFDEFAMLLGVKRLPKERNAELKERLLGVFKNPGNATKEGLLNGISRELNLKKEEVNIGSLADKYYLNTLMESDGTASKRLIDYVNRINKSLGYAWDSMNWGEAYWRSIEETKVGFYYLPHIWDGFSDTWKDNEIQSGIGDGDDLKVYAPRNESNVRNFKTYVGLRGIEPNSEEIHPEISFKYKITAKGKIPNKEYKKEDYKYTIVASEVIKLNYIIRAFKSFLYETRIDWTEHSYSFENSSSPGMEVVTGEDVLHYQKDKYIKLIAELATADKTKTPVLKDVTIDWLDAAGNTYSHTITSANDFTNNEISKSEFLDTFATETGEIELGYGDLYYVIDTEGDFLQGTRTAPVKVLKDGSITLDISRGGSKDE